MQNTYFDIFSLLLYVSIGVLGAVLIKKANINRARFVPFIRSGEFLFYVCFVCLFVGLAVCRQVGNNIGGIDALSYINIFENSLKQDGRFETQEQLFLILNKAIRYVTDDYKFYFLICYSIIAFSYIFFIRNFIPEDISYSPFILLIFPFLKSFNTLRSSLAVALFLIALVFLKKKKTRFSFIIILATFFVHRMSALFILFIPFYLIYKKTFTQLSGSRLYLFFAINILAGYACAKLIQQYVLAIQLVSSTDSYYLSTSIGVNIFERWPMMFPYILLFIAYVFGYKKLDDNNTTNLLKLLCAFDIIIMPVSLVLGMWRANEYLYVARLTMWGLLLYQYAKIFAAPSRKIFEVVVLLAFISWLVFRLCSEGEEIGVMPYIINIF